MKKIKVAYVCVHNSCRSQMAEAIAKKYYSDKFYSYSAGTHTKDIINQDAVRVFKIIEGVEMNEEHKPKLISDIPELDIVITMGCNVNCPTLPSKFINNFIFCNENPLILIFVFLIINIMNIQDAIPMSSILINFKPLI